MSSNLRNLQHLIIYSITAIIFFLGCNSVESVESKITLNFASTTGFEKVTTDTLQLDTIKILLRDIKIRNQSTGDNSDVKVETIVVQLNLSGVTSEFAVGNIPPGNYDRIKFKVHKVDPFEAPPDAEFRGGSNELLRYSVIVKGIFNSAPFHYKSLKPAYQDIKLETPLIIDENGVANLTILVDPFSWFTEGTSILDPNDSTNSDKIDKKIKESFKKAFQDK